MGSFEDIMKELSKYVLSILLLVIGILFLSMYLNASDIANQPKDLLLASLFILFGAVLALPQVYSSMTKMVKLILLVLVFACSCFLGLKVYDSINDEIELLAAQKAYETKLIQKFTDLRDVEVAYKKVNGRYTKDVSQLTKFVNSKVIPISLRWGVFHDTISGGEDEYREKGYVLHTEDLDSVAAMLGISAKKLSDDINADLTEYKVRDTLYVSYWDENLKPEHRKDKELPEMDLSLLGQNPNGKDFIIAVGSTTSGGTKVSTIEVKDPTPFDRQDGIKLDTLKFGALDAFHTDGNWITVE